MNTADSTLCPVCATPLVGRGRDYTVDELFSMWLPVAFSQATIDEHKTQSKVTRLHVCPKCELEIFLPQIIGTPNFYIDLQ